MIGVCCLIKVVQYSNKVLLSTPATQATDLRVSGTFNFTPPCIFFRHPVLSEEGKVPVQNLMST